MERSISVAMIQGDGPETSLVEQLRDDCQQMIVLAAPRNDVVVL